MSLWLPSSHVEPTFREATRSILQTLGKEIEVHDEKQLDMATALSASGPAYVFAFLEALIAAGEAQGLPTDAAEALAFQTVYGAAKLAKESPAGPAALRQQVSSPGGTTVAGLEALQERGWSETIGEAVAAATQRARELGRGH